MKNINAALWVEYKKIKKSKILIATITIFTFIPLMMGLMMFVSKNPEIASKMGMFGTKANMFGQNDWSGFLNLLNQILASIGLIGFGFVTSWVFGREYIDRTLKDILSLPIKRSTIVLSKFIVIFLWCTLLTLVLYCVAFIVGTTMNIQGWSLQIFLEFSQRYFLAALFTMLLCPIIAFIVGYSRGIIAPLGFIILSLIMAQFIGLVGLGPYFPWAIPGLFAVAKENEGLHLVTSSYFILISTFGIGYWATQYSWKNADHH